MPPPIVDIVSTNADATAVLPAAGRERISFLSKTLARVAGTLRDSGVVKIRRYIVLSLALRLGPKA